MLYVVYLEYANGRTRSSRTRCHSKLMLQDKINGLYNEKELLRLAERIIVEVDGKVIYAGPTAYTRKKTWYEVDKLTNDIGKPRAMKNGTPVTVYLPAALKDVLRAKGNGSVSAGLLNTLRECKDKNVLKEVNL